MMVSLLPKVLEDCPGCAFFLTISSRGWEFHPTSGGYLIIPLEIKEGVVLGSLAHWPPQTGLGCWGGTHPAHPLHS